MTTRHALTVACVLAASLSATASAQSTTLERFRPSETVDDGFHLSRPGGLGHLRVSAQLHLDYANDPLVYELDLGDAGSESASIVEHHLVGTVGAALGLYDRFVVFAALPMNLYMSGDDDAAQAAGVATADGFGLGDMSLGGRAVLLGLEPDDFFALAGQLSVTLPTGQGNYRGDDLPTVHPEALLELRPGIARFTANVGARVRKDQRLEGGALIGDELTFGLGLTIPIYGTHLEPGTTRVDLHAQFFGATAFGEFFDRESTPLEVIAGAKLHHESGFVAGLAGGAGTTRGVGSPDARVIATFGWATPVEAAGESSDEDDDGIDDDDDECVSEPEDIDEFQDTDGCPDLDNDGDGVLDVDDRCPMQAGEASSQGCPIADDDSDGDGIADADDQCVDQAEDVDRFEDADGCPDPDNDQDGVADGADRCPLEAGPVENRGCPDTDRDEDGIVDRLDNCPDEPGTEANHGCEAEQRVFLAGDHLEILDKVYFETSSAEIQQRSFPLLENVAQVLNNHTEIDEVQIEGHTDDRGDDAMNLRLSQQRAESVREFLISKNVDGARLTARGFGETRPLESNDTAQGRAANRRVEFNLGGPVEGVEQNGARTEETTR
ncbi:MAG: OmpA family protein [Deltaproteobacteria bacterium]|nr:OmpA family protein [Deltaproteobacteria bacterium]